MKHISILAISFFLMSFAGAASADMHGDHSMMPSPEMPQADVSSKRIGFGVQSSLTGLGGLSLVLDQPKYHIDFLFGFSDAANTTNLELGGRFLYHLKQSDRADFSLGGGLGINSINVDGPGDATILDLEIVFQIRAFLTEAVALSATGGIAVRAADGDGVVAGGQAIGAAGIVYYF